MVLKKIVNVYQLNYTNEKSPGLGDFLRGCFCFMQLAQLFNLQFDIDISHHPIAKFIKNVKGIEGIDYNNIERYKELNTDSNNTINYEGIVKNINKDFLYKTRQWLISQNKEVFGFFSNAFPCFNKHTIEGRQFLMSKLEPNEVMETYINSTLNKINLTKKNYGVIHIRTGDDFLVNNKPMNIIFINKIKNLLNKLILKDKKYLIISDSNVLKQHLKTFPNFFIIIKPIAHLGGENNVGSLNFNETMNTLLDFYLMSYSNSILSLSVYAHVSGFSKYCSIIYDIPFKTLRLVI
jgi:hypothetical protein